MWSEYKEKQMLSKTQGLYRFKYFRLLLKEKGMKVKILIKHTYSLNRCSFQNKNS